MDNKVFEALKKIMGAIGQVEDGEIYLYDPYAQDASIFEAYDEVTAWMNGIAKKVA